MDQEPRDSAAGKERYKRFKRPPKLGLVQISHPLEDPTLRVRKIGVEGGGGWGGGDEGPNH